MNNVEQVVTYLLQVVAVTLVQIFTLGGPLLALLLLVSWLSAVVARLAGWAMGGTLYLLFFGWLGTTIHETGHLLFAAAFGQQIQSFKLFAPDRRSGTLGSVAIRNDGNLVQYIGLFFFGIAPVMFGPLIIFLAFYFLFNDQMPEVYRQMSADAESAGEVMRHIVESSFGFLTFLFSPEHLLDWRLYVFLYIAFAVGSSIHLSAADLKLVRMGCLTFVAILFLFNLALLPLGVSSGDTFTWVSPFYTFFYVILVFVMLLNLFAAILLWLPASVRRSARKSG